MSAKIRVVKILPPEFRRKGRFIVELKAIAAVQIQHAGRMAHVAAQRPRTLENAI